MTQRYVQIRHHSTGAVIAQGPLGWGITPFEGNYYIRRQYLRDGHFRIDHVPGLCVYKGLYVGLNYIAPDRTVSKHLGWMYWLPNPLLPFIMYRVAIPGYDPLLVIDSVDGCSMSSRDPHASATVLNSTLVDKATRHVP